MFFLVSSCLVKLETSNDPFPNGECSPVSTNVQVSLFWAHLVDEFRRQRENERISIEFSVFNLWKRNWRRKETICLCPTLLPQNDNKTSPTPTTTIFIRTFRYKEMCAHLCLTNLRVFVATSVTGWLQLAFKIWPLTTMKFAQPK